MTIDKGSGIERCDQRPRHDQQGTAFDSGHSHRRLVRRSADIRLNGRRTRDALTFLIPPSLKSTIIVDVIKRVSLTHIGISPRANGSLVNSICPEPASPELTADLRSCTPPSPPPASSLSSEAPEDTGKRPPLNRPAKRNDNRPTLAVGQKTPATTLIFCHRRRRPLARDRHGVT